MKFIIPLSAPEASDANCVGPKAANLAALGRAGLPIPDGFCLSADAYRMQIAALGLEQAAVGGKLDTRRYTKRQLTWFRHQMPGWIWVTPGAAEATIMAALAAK